MSSPYNEGARYFPIMNDRLLWRMWKPSDLFERNINKKDPYDYGKFHLLTYSSTDLVKSACDENEFFVSKIKCLKGKSADF